MLQGKQQSTTIPNHPLLPLDCRSKLQIISCIFNSTTSTITCTAARHTGMPPTAPAAGPPHSSSSSSLHRGGASSVEVYGFVGWIASFAAAGEWQGETGHVVLGGCVGAVAVGGWTCLCLCVAGQVQNGGGTTSPPFRH